MKTSPVVLVTARGAAADAPRRSPSRAGARIAMSGRRANAIVYRASANFLAGAMRRVKGRLTAG
ncbi:hypothetical protein H3V53_16115 [Paraburkholderia bengalensis]|uniref:Uncharacterized protein n=1 Tax=Paraburkholderia bengalensis TaxID=2747562 RepID=A0ABU8ITD0_9BURK